MAEKWVNNDSAREMTRKYNNGVQELNQITRMMLAVNDGYVTTIPSDFAIDEENDDLEAEYDGT